MLRLCSPFPMIDLLASGSLLLLSVFWFLLRRARQSEEQVDGNQRLMIQLTILAIFTDLSFLFFVIAWRPC